MKIPNARESIICAYVHALTGRPLVANVKYSHRIRKRVSEMILSLPNRNVLWPFFFETIHTMILIFGRCIRFFFIISQPLIIIWYFLNGFDSPLIFICVTCTLRVFNLIVKNSTTLYILLAFVYVQLCFNNEKNKTNLEIVYLILVFLFWLCLCV